MNTSVFIDQNTYILDKDTYSLDENVQMGVTFV